MQQNFITEKPKKSKAVNNSVTEILVMLPLLELGLEELPELVGEEELEGVEEEGEGDFAEGEGEGDFAEEKSMESKLWRLEFPKA